MTRNTILAFIGHYLPGFEFGGPVRALSNLVAELQDEFEFRIVTRDRDVGDDSPYPGIRRDCWTRVGGAKVMYTAPRSRSVGALASVMRDTPHDLQYFNSFFDPIFTLRPTVAVRMGRVPRRPRVIAPHGEFSAAALDVKPVRKRLFLTASRILELHKGALWQASNSDEAGAIRKVLGTESGVFIAPPIASGEPLTRRPAPAESRVAPSTPIGALRIVFLSRINRMKNLRFALEVLAAVEHPVEFHIFGPIDDEPYWDRCARFIRAKMPEHIQVEVHGAVPHPKVIEVLSGYDMLFLPSLGESFCYVVLEAWQAGIPVLISDRTPWRNLDDRHAGWDLPLEEPGAFRSIIETQAKMPREARAEMNRQVEAHAARILSRASKSAEQARELFRAALRYGDREVDAPGSNGAGSEPDRD